MRPTRFNGDERDRLVATLAAVRAAGSNRAAAAALGVHENTICRRLKRAAALGLDGSTARAAAPGRRVSKVSTLHNLVTGKPVAQWVQEKPDGEIAPEALAELIREVLAGVPAPALPPAPSHAEADLLTLLPLADLHNGMRAWAEETGEDYDLRIADGVLRGALGAVLDRAPPSAELVILGLGDITHADNDRNETERSGNRLDADTRHQKTVRMTLELLLWLIGRAAERFQKVSVRILKGNHDPQTAAAISLALALLFRDSDRVAVDDSPSLWWFREFGACLLGATHGHTLKPEAMPGVMASDRAEAWGRTVWRHIHRGHHHNRSAIEAMGVTVECHRSPAAKDAYHAAGPWRSLRSVSAITYHARDGEIARVSVNIPKREART